MFWKHPAKVCMTYFGHMKLSFGFAKDLFVASQQAIIHGIFPDYYVDSTSQVIETIQKKMSDVGCR